MADAPGPTDQPDQPDPALVLDWRNRTRALSFGDRAELYDRMRPGYPPAILAPLLRDTRSVADVGAGTGKLTRVLLEAGYDVTAVEPDPGMRAELAARAPGVTVLDGTGESIPLPDASVDAVTFAQAWHWVDPPSGLREAARVLRPGGALVILWNTDVVGVDWLDQLGAQYGKGRAAYEDLSIPLHEQAAAAGYLPVEAVDVAWEQELRVDALGALAMTWSIVATRPEAEQERVLAGIAELGRTHPALAGRETVGYPHLCRGFAFRRPA